MELDNYLMIIYIYIQYINEPTVAYLGSRHRGGTFVTGMTLVLYADKIPSKVID